MQALCARWVGLPAAEARFVRRTAMRVLCEDRLIAILLLAACAGPGGKDASGAKPSRPQAQLAVVPETAQALSSSLPSPTDSARLLYWSFADKFGRSRAELVARLGPPASVTTDTSQNRYDSTEVDTVVTLRYSTAAVGFFVFQRGGEFPVLVSVRDPAVKLPIKVGIGASRPDLERVFGPPDDVIPQGDSTLVQFKVPGQEDTALVFTLVGGVVREVGWATFPD